jgi:hypothetical protein
MPAQPSTPAEAPPDEEAPSLTVKPETVCFIILKAREFDAKDVVTDPDDGSNAVDDSMISVLEDHPDDPVLEELTSVIGDLSEDEQVDLVALAWMGREDNTIEDWPTLRQEAARAHVSHGRHTASYLLGMPLLGDYLEEGLSQLGISCGSVEG